MSNAVYDHIDKFVVSAVCREPLHVGGSTGDKEDVLISPVDDTPFIQATGICGALRGYCAGCAGKQAADEMFGNTEQNRESRIKVSDGRFKADTIRIELRPHVKIDPETGTVSSKKLRGGESAQSGQVFDSQYVSSGAEFRFEICLYNGTDDEKKLVLKALAALNAGEFQLGGLKSSGCGYIGIGEVLSCQYDMTDRVSREKWIREDDSDLKTEELPSLEPEDLTSAFDIVISASTENELLVKGIAVDKFGKDAPKAENIKNGQGKYIVPGSSIRGSIRNRMEMICDYMHLDPSLITDAFGNASESGGTGKTGNLKFRDVVMEDSTKENLRTRIRIDKFTGGVFNGGLFSELNISGDLEIHVQVADRENPEAVTGLLLLAVRDLGRKLYSLGGGQSVGKGYMNVKKITVTDLRVKEPESAGKCCLNQDFEITEGRQVLDACMEKLRDLAGCAAVKEE